MAKCPYCGKKLSENERYCWHCENDLSKMRDELEKPEAEEQH
jgi:predicted amidophosphoribosyltransferase